jgi:hypothetical protein
MMTSTRRILLARWFGRESGAEHSHWLETAHAAEVRFVRQHWRKPGTEAASGLRRPGWRPAQDGDRFCGRHQCRRTDADDQLDSCFHGNLQELRC